MAIPNISGTPTPSPSGSPRKSSREESANTPAAQNPPAPHSKTAFPRPPQEEATKLEINVGPVSQKRPLAGIPAETVDCIVAVHAHTDSEFPSGVGCVISPNHILTTWSAAGVTQNFDAAALMGKEIVISLPWLSHRPKLTTKIVKAGGGTRTNEFLILLQALPARAFDASGVFVTTPKLATKEYVVAGFSQDDPDGITASGWIGEAGPDGRYELARPNEERLSGFRGSPVWSPELNGIVGLVSDGNPGWCIPASRISEFVPELPVQFKISKSDRPKKVDLNVDYNRQLFPNASSEGNGRRLRAEILERLGNNAYRVRMTYELLPGAEPARGRYVTFVTYPNMGDEHQIVAEIGDTRKVDAICNPLIPDFTIAAIGDAGDTRLTLNLKDLPKPINIEVNMAGVSTVSASGVTSATGSITSEQDSRESESQYRRTFAFYSNDQAPYANRRQPGELKDALGNKDYARQMAHLICARLTPMPLSLGLFGDWGSGKSYFMGLLHNEIETIKQQQDEVFHRKVVQIHFNAWHYLDTNLWANLVCEIFDNLFKELIAGKEFPDDKVKELKQKLAAESALAEEARKALEDAKKAREAAEKKLQYAAQQRQKQERTVANFLDELQSVVLTEDVNKDLEALAKGFGLSRLNESFSELESTAKEAQSVVGRFRTFGLALLGPEGRGGRIFWLALALVSPVLIAFGVAAVLKIKDAELAGITRAITTAATMMGTVAAWIAMQAKRGAGLINKLEQTYAKVNKARENARANNTQTRAQQLELDKRIKEEVEAQHALQEAQTKLHAIEAELRELAPGRRLLKFLEQRAGANDYRQHLGLISLVRRDFEKLSELVNDGNEPKAGENKESPVLNRIVLYIDDLDRCKSDRVIAVLEAVHLLLAFPIFAVVVAVDPRWLRKSLLEHYPTLLVGGRDKDGKPMIESRESLASPQDYLEKIFQVPFQLEPIEKVGFTKLVVDLLPVTEKKMPAQDKKPEAKTDPAANLNQSVPVPGTPNPLPAGSTGVNPVPSPIPSPTSGPDVVQNITPPSSSGAAGNANQTKPEAEKPAAAQPLNPERLQLEEWERAAIQLCYPLFRTPRAVKRLANTYCLIRTGVEAGEGDRVWKQFIGSASNPVAEYRTPLLMLAVAAAYPGLAREWFEQLQKSGGWWNAAASKVKAPDEESDWNQLASALKKMQAEQFAAFDKEQVSNWLPRVKRYSF